MSKPTSKRSCSGCTRVHCCGNSMCAVDCSGWSSGFHGNAVAVRISSADSAAYCSQVSHPLRQAAGRADRERLAARHGRLLVGEAVEAIARLQHFASGAIDAAAAASPSWCATWRRACPGPGRRTTRRRCRRTGRGRRAGWEHRAVRRVGLQAAALLVLAPLVDVGGLALAAALLQESIAAGLAGAYGPGHDDTQPQHGDPGSGHAFTSCSTVRATCGDRVGRLP